MTFPDHDGVPGADLGHDVADDCGPDQTAGVADGLGRDEPGTGRSGGAQRAEPDGPHHAGGALPDSTELVRRGYDHLSHRYRSDHEDPGEYAPWLTHLQQQLPAHARVLDLGCGCGIPVAKTLTDHGHQVTGVDLSEVQINRARELVPRATFLQADATQIAFPDGTFDAIVCLYALIHMPRDTQPQLLQRIATWLRPGGILLTTTGAQEWTGTQDHWLGGTATMWWSHADAATYRDWITQAGLTIDSEHFVPEGDSGHQLYWAHRPADSGQLQ